MRIHVKLLIIFQIILFVSFSNTPLEAETLFESFGVGLPAVNVSDTPEGETTYSLSLQILALMTVLTVLPSLILGMTSFTRIIIVLSIVLNFSRQESAVAIRAAQWSSIFLRIPSAEWPN